MSNNNTNTNNSSTIDESKIIGKPYMGPTKLAYDEHGQKVMVPDLEPLSNPFVPTPVHKNNNYSTSPAVNKEFKYRKTLDDVLSATDKFQFDRLKTDEQRYAMIKNMITGLDGDTTYSIFNSEIGNYVHGDPRTLHQIFADLINEKKVYLNSNDGNLYSFKYAIDNKMIQYPCRYCSKVLYNEDDRRMHSFSHMARQQQ